MWDLEEELRRVSGGELTWVARRSELVFRPRGGPVPGQAVLRVGKEALRNHLRALMLKDVDRADGGGGLEAALRSLARTCHPDAWHALDPFATLRSLGARAPRPAADRWRRTPSGADRLLRS